VSDARDQGVTKRLVFYIAGYDPRGPKAYYELFRRELGRAARNHGLQQELSDFHPGEDGAANAASWRVENVSDGSPVSTTFNFLGWHDLAAREFSYSLFRRLIAGAVTYVDYFRRGMFRKFLRAHWPFFAFLLYPCVALSLYLGIFAVGGFVAASLTAGLGASLPVQILAEGIVVLALYWLTVRLDRHLFVYYEINAWISAHRVARDADPDLFRRLDDFGQEIAKAARDGDFDEVIVAGHSAGGYLAMLATAKAFDLQPDLGRVGPKVALMTLGSVLPMVAYFEEATKIRHALADLIANPNLLWLEYWDRNDILNFPDMDHVNEFGLDMSGRERINPISRTARFRQILSKENFNRFRFKFFRLHFQYIMANDIVGDYDYIDFLTSPRFLKDRIPVR